MSFSPHPTLTQEYTELIDELTSSVQANYPEDIIQFCADFFIGKLSQQRQAWWNQAHGLMQEHPYSLSIYPLQPSPPRTVPTLQEPSSYEPYSSDDDEDDDDLFAAEADDVLATDLPDFSMLSASCNRGRRTSVSAESMTPSQNTNYVRTVIPKTPEQQARIQAAIQANFLFRNLDEIQYRDVINAMTEKPVPGADEIIIQQGAIGDYFYIVESGTLDCYINDEKVTSYSAGDSFGELALMYNSPRAATIITTSSCVLWALDRITFRRILMENTYDKRKMYECFLAEVPILASLDGYERFKVADALESVCFEDGDIVIEQGAIGNNFYLIESGEAIFYKTVDGVQKEINRLTKGAYFGELALLNDSPRAATVVARGRLRCATLGKKGFNRLLGPILDILKRNSENYARIMQTNEFL
ncbi:cyclic nucleotide-binding-like protein [Radiomyces spectabilis]|uniref:cyclic nucleotide-binding-like protein n=1 Tax=Radiomyces spectabilis TaxID=64574 RepID=UPI00221EA3F3|nr:cyclic nucleotide-binding-like protein [Radiomyces spectabilis]KAI8374369.1 cyclic nucleotide-binding-like protein [Radiomyces spectabilis]